MPHARGRATMQIGTYVPAMRKKIIEWSRRCMIARARGVRARRWYAADVPNSASRLAK